MADFGPETDRIDPFSSAPSCPGCGRSEAYVLADGRRQCRHCRKKYTCAPSHSRLSTLVQQELAQHFWQMVPAESTAKTLKINRKTVQQHYNGLRLLLAEEAQSQFTRHLKPLLNRDTTDLPAPCQKFHTLPNPHLPVFWATHYQGRYHVLFPSPELNSTIQLLQQRLSSVMVIAFSRHDRDRLLIDRFQQTALSPVKNSPTAPSMVNFWSDTRTALRKYRGGFKRNFPLFVQEMAYRLSYPEQKAPPHLLLPAGSA